jgi:hypothetical protein
MRVLLIPELYRPDDPSANGTLGDVRMWVRGWVDRDESLHVYWLVSPEIPDEEILADREQVTAIRAEPFGDPDSEAADLFTEGGYSWAELAAIRRVIFDRGAYLDAVVDQRRTGRFDLVKWLCGHTDHWAADVQPIDVIVNVHDLQVPRKYRYCSYRDAFQSRMEMAAAVFADGIWFNAGVDARRMREHATAFLRPEIVEETLDGALETGSPIDFDEFEESYADEPRYLHLVGSLWDKKCADRLLAVGERLHDEFGVETLLTSMEPIPGEYAAPEWVTAFPEADRETYENLLRRGDLAAEAVEDWNVAVRENRRLVAHAARVRDPDRSARRTLRDLRKRVEQKRERYDLGPADAPVRTALEDADADRIDLADLRERTADYTSDHAKDGTPVTDREDYAFADLVYALRSLGYRDAGNPGTPVFVTE